MGLYKLFSSQVEIQYKSYLLSKATLFTFIITMLNIIVPFIIAYRSRGFWLKSQSFYEQPVIHFTYEYLLVAETQDPSQPIICSEIQAIDESELEGEETCTEIEVDEIDYNRDGKNDAFKLNFRLNVPPDRILTSLVIILGINFQLKSVCPIHMQSLTVVSKDFGNPPASFNYLGDLQLYQTSHLPCLWGHVDIKYNNSLLDFPRWRTGNIVDFILNEYYNRDVTIQSKPIYERIQYVHPNSVNTYLNIHLRIPEMQIRYTPGILQELKWMWPQYLSIVLVFYWIFNKVKRYVFKKRLFMAWEIVPWKKSM